MDMLHVLCSCSRVMKITTTVLMLLVAAGCSGGDLSTAPTQVVTPPVVPVPTSAYDMQLRIVGDGATPRIRDAFAKGIVRWRDIIVGDIGTTRLDMAAGECQSWLPAIRESVNDLVVYVRVTSIDGTARVVARASPCYVNSDNRLPIMGFVELDSSDVDDLVQRDVLDDVVLHELGHVLGIGTLWNFRRTLLSDVGTDDPFFTGSAARSAFMQVGGALYSGFTVPVENIGPAGTRDVHWRASVFGRELMQGVAIPGGMPLSRVTVASLGDLGYTIAMNKADPFSLFAALRMGDEAPDTGVALGHDVEQGPLFEVDRQGRTRRISPAPQ
jgi:hypothetical protein